MSAILPFVPFETLAQSHILCFGYLTRPHILILNFPSLVTPSIPTIRHPRGRAAYKPQASTPSPRGRGICSAALQGIESQSTGTSIQGHDLGRYPTTECAIFERCRSFLTCWKWKMNTGVKEVRQRFVCSPTMTWSELRNIVL